jgi:hypothetical protein
MRRSNRCRSSTNLCKQNEYWWQPDNGPYLAPLDTDLGKNVTLAGNHPGDYLWLIQMVWKGQEWDYKKQDPDDYHTYEDFGNYNYGAITAAMSIPEYIALNGAGIAQIFTGTPGEGIPFIQAPYGDDPNDQAKIKEGYNAYGSIPLRF